MIICTIPECQTSAGCQRRCVPVCAAAPALSTTKPARGDGEKLRNAANALCKVALDLDLGRSIHNSRFPDQPIEGPLWKKLMEAASEVADILAPAALAAQGDDAQEGTR